tara:strand:+ start:301 stop:588 length:288 start_codon:yes stop_codon:yes gene_type:complete
MISAQDLFIAIFVGMFSIVSGLIGFVILVLPPFLIWIFIMRLIIKFTNNDYLRSCYEKPNDKILYLIISFIIVLGGIMPLWYKLIGSLFLNLVGI